MKKSIVVLIILISFSFLTVTVNAYNPSKVQYKLNSFSLYMTNQALDQKAAFTAKYSFPGPFLFLFNFTNILNDYLENSLFNTSKKVEITLVATEQDNKIPSIDMLEKTNSIITARMINVGFSHVETTIDTVLAEINIKADCEKELDPKNLIDQVIKTGLLTFQEVNEKNVDANGNYKPIGKIIISGEQIVESSMATNSNTGQIVVNLKLNKEGTKKFASATKRLIGHPIAIFLDEKMLSAPMVADEIKDGNIQIAGNFSAQEAGDLATTIKLGSLPVQLSVKYFNVLK